MLMPLYVGLSLAATGCEMFSSEKSTPSDTLLQAARMAPDSVAMEVFFIRLPHDDRQTYDAIWREVDEASLDATLRRRLSENGLRAGVVAAQLPTPLQTLLQRYKVDTPRQEAAQPTEGLQQANTVKLDTEPAVSMRRLQLGSGRRGEVIASGLKPRAEVLIKEENLVRGRTFQECQGLFAIKAFPLPDGRARFEIVPELHHGEPQQRFTGSDGVWRLETARPRQVFDDLMLNVTLASGEMVLIGSVPEKPGSLGHHFFTEDQGGEVQRKVLFVRLTHTQLDDRFTPADASRSR